MKKLLSILFLTFLSYQVHSQIVNIPDVDFKSKLVNDNCVDTNNDGIYDDDADTNDDGEIQISEAIAVVSLNVGLSGNIRSFEGLESFTNIEVFSGGNSSTGRFEVYLDVRTLTKLREYTFSMYEKSYPIVDLTKNINLEKIRTFYSGIILGEAPNLHTLDAQWTVIPELDLLLYNNLTSLSLDSCSLYQHLDLSQSPNLTQIDLSVTSFPSINIKNGRLDYDILGFQHSTFKYACVDDFELEETEAYAEGMFLGFGFEIEVNTYCSFIPGGTTYMIQGYNVYDADSNGCDASDPAYPNLKFNITNGTENSTYIADGDGEFQFSTLEGITSMTPVLENPEYFNVIPNSAAIDFSIQESPFTQVFCISPNGTHNDLEVILIPLSEARPGFDVTYQIVYENKGNTTLSGSIALDFEDNLMDFINSTPSANTQSAGSLTWDFNNLNPFDQSNIFLSMNLNSPQENPALNDGDVVSFTATANISENDETPTNNVHLLNQTIVNSFDPNNKTCLEGEFISQEQIGEYVHYLVRFENLGSADAVNIVVKDNIDLSKFDITSLTPIRASHNYTTKITNNSIEFIFENINLPFDDANNDGFITFKIKTLETLNAGDTLENTAEIYFDFNPEITTNTTQSIIATLNINEHNLEDKSIVLYPNPTNQFLKIEASTSLKNITIYDVSGRLLKKIEVIGNQKKTNINTESLNSGSYFVKVETHSSSSINKIIKN